MVNLDLTLAKKLIDSKKWLDEDMKIVDNNRQTTECRYSWLKHEKKTIYSCRIDTGVVVATHDGLFVSSLSNMEGCNYSLKQCLTHNGRHVFWDTIDKVDKDYIPVGSYI